MNKVTLSKLMDFFINLAVASFAVSAYQGLWLGALIGTAALLFALRLGETLGGTL